MNSENQHDPFIAYINELKSPFERLMYVGLAKKYRDYIYNITDWFRELEYYFPQEHKAFCKKNAKLLESKNDASVQIAA